MLLAWIFLLIINHILPFLLKESAVPGGEEEEVEDNAVAKKKKSMPVYPFNPPASGGGCPGKPSFQMVQDDPHFTR